MAIIDELAKTIDSVLCRHTYHSMDISREIAKEIVKKNFVEVYSCITMYKDNSPPTREYVRRSLAVEMAGELEGVMEIIEKDEDHFKDEYMWLGKITIVKPRE